MVLNKKTNFNQTNSILERGVEEIIVKEHLERVLKSGKKLRVKLGIDPTSPELHLGHLVQLRKLKQFQDAGHKIVLIIGDFTAMIGDPSGRSETRKSLTEAEIKKNFKRYAAQAGKIIDIKRSEVRFNSLWHKKGGLVSILKLASVASIQQILRRADFQDRLEKNQDISVLEILYPLFQGYDSVMVQADVEIGGTDQKFNLLMGRRVQRAYNQPEQDVMTLSLLLGTDGVRKMSKSCGNFIALDEKPAAMFGKVMSIPDSLIESYSALLTDLKLDKNAPPYESKLGLAKEVVRICHGDKTAVLAAEEFKKVFSEKGAPSQMTTLRVKKVISLVDLVLASGVKSKSEARRLIEQGAVEIDGVKKIDAAETIKVDKSSVLKIGKSKFVRIVS